MQRFERFELTCRISARGHSIMLFAEEIRWPSLMGLMIFLTTDFSDGGDVFDYGFF